MFYYKLYKINFCLTGFKIATMTNKVMENESSLELEVKVKKDINILILGETGVGKSTFINALANYWTFSTLQEAQKNDPLYLISSKFVITDDDFKEVVIKIGDDKNENQETGESATQYTRVYTFPLPDNSTFIRVIDTPGIADTRGLDQDNINIENILRQLEKYDELHAVCILLKPNNARITVQFEYCIKQILSRLDKSVSDNIIFIFTNSRSSLYRPGDTLPALRKVLDQIKSKPPHVNIPLGKENTFCMDNEAYRFLLAAYNKIKFSNEDVKNFKASWEKSRTTSLEYVFMLSIPD